MDAFKGGRDQMGTFVSANAIKDIDRVVCCVCDKELAALDKVYLMEETTGNMIRMAQGMECDDYCCEGCKRRTMMADSL